MCWRRKGRAIWKRRWAGERIQSEDCAEPCEPLPAVLDYIAGLKVPVIVGPIYEMPKDEERFDAVYSLPAELDKRGVKIAFAAYDAHGVAQSALPGRLRDGVRASVRGSTESDDLNPAEIWGVADKLGSLDAGKTANVVVANGDPLDVKTDVKQGVY